MFKKYLRESSDSKKLLVSREAFKFVSYGHTLIGWRSPTKKGLYHGMYQVFSGIIISFNIYLPIALMISYVREFENFTPGELITSAQLMFNLPSCYAKAAFLYFNLWRLEKAKEILDEMDKSCTKNAEKLQIHRSVVLCNSIFFIIFVIYNMYSVSTLSTALINGVAPWNVYNPILNWRDGTWELLLSSLIEFILVYFPAVYNNAADIYPVIYGLTIRLHINLLIKRIELLRCDDNRSEEEHYEELTGCIKDHKRLLEYFNILRPLISCTIFIQFLFVGVVLGLCLTNLFFFCDFWSGIATLVYIIAVFCQTFPFSYICNTLEEDNDRLTLTIFQSNWLSASQRYKSALIYFIHKAQQPVQFTAGSIFKISLHTNISIAKLAFSVVTIIQQFNLAEKLERK